MTICKWALAQQKQDNKTESIERWLPERQEDVWLQDSFH